MVKNPNLTLRLHCDLKLSDIQDGYELPCKSIVLCHDFAVEGRNVLQGLECEGERYQICL